MKTKILITIKILAFIVANLSFATSFLEFVASFFLENNFTWTSFIVGAISAIIFRIIEDYGRLYHKDNE